MLLLGPMSMIQVHESSLTVSVTVATIIAEALVNANSIVKDWLIVHLRHNLRFKLSFLTVLNISHNCSRYPL